MFRRALCFFIALTIAVAALCLFFHVRFRPSDVTKYQKLVRESADLRAQKALAEHPAHQTREGVQKDIWMVKNDERSHIRIKSAHSDLTIAQKKGKFKAIEKLQDLQCWIEEQIDRVEKTREVRTLIAREGTYSYPSHRFLAERVELNFYHLPGEELSYEEMQLQFSAFADTALFSCKNELEPHLFELNGNIRLISPNFREKMSFASADMLSYFPTEKRMTLSAISPKRVLFWQKGFSLSAPEVMIGFKDQETIEGMGDVHFTLDLDEQHTLEKLFSNYL